MSEARTVTLMPEPDVEPVGDRPASSQLPADVSASLIGQWHVHYCSSGNAFWCPPRSKKAASDTD